MVKKLKFLMTPILALGLILGIGVSHGLAEVSTVTVEEGDTLWNIAASHENVTIYDLYEWNPGIDPYNLQVGSEVVIYPGSDYYRTVTAGDTFYSIAATYDYVTLADLYVLNTHIDPFNLQIGSQVRLKSFDYGYEYYEIQPGDTLYWISVVHDVPISDLYSFNPGIDPLNLPIGLTIRLR